MTALLAGCAGSSRSENAQPNTSGGGNPLQDAMLDGCPNAEAIRGAVLKAQKANDEHAKTVRRTAEAATRAFYSCSRTGTSDLARDWAMLNTSYWLAHTALQDQSGVKTLDESIHYLAALQTHTNYPEIRDEAKHMSDTFLVSEENLKQSLAHGEPSP